VPAVDRPAAVPIPPAVVRPERVVDMCPAVVCAAAVLAVPDLRCPATDLCAAVAWLVAAAVLSAVCLPAVLAPLFVASAAPVTEPVSTSALNPNTASLLRRIRVTSFLWVPSCIPM